MAVGAKTAYIERSSLWENGGMWSPVGHRSSGKRGSGPIRSTLAQPKPKARNFAPTPDATHQDIKAASFKVEPRRVVTETVSGTVATSQHRGFTRLLDRLEAGEVLVATNTKSLRA